MVIDVLVPAILYKDEIIKCMQKYFYTDDMMFETGCMDNWTPNITECPEGSQFQYAIVDNNEKLIGYLGYDNFIKRHNGNKHILKDCIKDRKGDYHDDIIYEIVKGE